MPSAEILIRDLCARIVPVPPDHSASPPEAVGIGALARRIATMQGLDTPRAALKGMALFAADPDSGHEGSEAVREWLGKVGPLHALSSHCDVKWLVADVGLKEDFSEASFGAQILPRLLRRMSPHPEDAIWDAMQEGVRLACRMKGKGTDLFGLCFLAAGAQTPRNVPEVVGTNAWPIATAAGFLLGAADLQTPVVLSGKAALAAASVACSLVEAVSGYILAAQPGEQPAFPIQSIPLLQWTAPHPLAVILGLDFCQSAAMLSNAEMDAGDGKAV